MRMHTKHPCLPPPPTDRSTHEVTSPQRTHNHADVVEVKWPSEGELDITLALIQLREFPVFFSNPGPQQEEGHAQVESAENEQLEMDVLEKNRVSAQDNVNDDSSFGSPGDPEFSSEKVVSNRKGKRNAITHALHMSRLNALITALAGPSKTLSNYGGKEKAEALCMKSEGFDGRAGSSAATTVDIKFTYVKSLGDSASRPLTGEQPSQPPYAMEDGRDKKCTRPAYAVRSALKTHQNFNKLGVENVKRVTLEVGEPSSAVLGATATMSELVLTHPPTSARRSRVTPYGADPAYEPVLSKQARLELLAPKPRLRPRRARAEVEEANRGSFFYVTNARVLKDANDIQMSWGPFLDGELLYNDNRQFVKAKSITALLKNGDDQEEE